MIYAISVANLCSKYRLYRFAALALVFLLICAAACSPAASTPRVDRSDVVAAVPAGSAARALQLAAEQYAGSGGERVRIAVLPADAYSEQVSGALLSGHGDYDLLYLPGESVARWVQYHALRPITAEVDAAPLAPWLPLLTFSENGASQVYALPAQPDPLLLWYRADLQQAANLPDPSSSLDAFRASALALNAPPERYGVAIAASEQEAGQDYAALLAGAPGELLEAFTSAEGQAYARQALSLYAGLSSPDRVTAPGSGQSTRAEVIAALREGRAAMGFAPLSAAADLLDCEKSPRACADGRPLLAAASLPGDADCAVLENVSVWGIPLHAANPAAAERFAAWLVSEQGARAWAEGGGLPAHTTVIQSLPEGAVLPAGAAALLGRAECYVFAFPARSASEQFWRAMNGAAHAAAAGQSPPEAAFERVLRDVRQVLRQGEVGR